MILTACASGAPGTSARSLSSPNFEESKRLPLDPTEYAKPGTHTVTLSIGGDERTYRLLVPTGYDGSPVPLLVGFHGYTMDPDQIVGAWGRLAQEHGFIVAAPEGLDRQWAVAHTEEEAAAAMPNSGLDLARHAIGDYDVEFTAAMLADVREYLAVAHDRIYVTGVSLGGLMASRVACEIGDHFAGLGPTLNSLLYTDPCPTNERLAVVTVGHLNDRTHAVEDAQAAARAWAEHNGCSPNVTEERSGRIAAFAHETCPSATPVEMYVHDLSWSGDSGEERVWEFFSALD